MSSPQHQKSDPTQTGPSLPLWLMLPLIAALALAVMALVDDDKLVIVTGGMWISLSLAAVAVRRGWRWRGWLSTIPASALGALLLLPVVELVFWIQSGIRAGRFDTPVIPSWRELLEVVGVVTFIHVSAVLAVAGGRLLQQPATTPTRLFPRLGWNLFGGFLGIAMPGFFIAAVITLWSEGIQGGERFGGMLLVVAVAAAMMATLVALVVSLTRPMRNVATREPIRLRFSLRTLAVAVLLLAALLGGGRALLHPYIAQQKAWIALEQAGAEVFVRQIDAQGIRMANLNDWLARYQLEPTGVSIFDRGFQDENLLLAGRLRSAPEIFLSADDLTDRTLEYVGRLSDTPVLYLASPHFTDEGLAHLVDLHNLQWLVINSEGVRGDGLRHVSGLPVETLRLECPNLGGAAMVHIGRMSNLTELWIRQIDVGFDPDAMRHLKDLKRLESLVLAGPGVSDDVLVHLKNLSNLSHLFLFDTSISDDGLAHLSGVTRLEKLVLTRTPIDGSGLRHLKDLPLHTLFLMETNVNDAALPAIEAIETLRTVLFDDTNVTPQAEQQLYRLIEQRR